MITPHASHPNAAIERKLFWFGVVATALGCLIFGVGSFWRHHLLFERSGYIVGRDFLNFWMMGRAIWEPEAARFYDSAVYIHMLQPFVGDMGYRQQWSYPPSFLLLVAPFGLLGYSAAYVLWSLAGIGMFAAFVLHMQRDAKVVALALLSPAAFFGFLSGQAALFFTAFIFGAFTLRERRPVLAGLLIGLLSVKPQLGLLFPVLLIAERRFLCFGVAALTALGLVLSISAIQGPEIWLRYVSVGIPSQAQVLLLSNPQNLASVMTSLYTDLRVMGVGNRAAFAIQTIGTVIAAIGVYRYCRQSRTGEVGFIFFTAASVFSTPYMLFYDLLPMTLALVLLVRNRTLQPRDKIVILLGFLLPVLRFATCWIPLPGASLIPALLMFWAWRRRPDHKLRIASASALKEPSGSASA